MRSLSFLNTLLAVIAAALTTYLASERIAESRLATADALSVNRAAHDVGNDASASTH
jgi:hypothetical protein